MHLRLARGNALILLLAVIDRVYPVRHRNERHKATGNDTERIKNARLKIHPRISADGSSLKFQPAEWPEEWRYSATFCNQVLLTGALRRVLLSNR